MSLPVWRVCTMCIRLHSPARSPYTKPIPIEKVGERIGTPYIKVDPEKVVAVIESNIPDNGRIVSPVDDGFRQMAANLIDFLHSEVRADRLCNLLPPLQVGVESASNAVLEGLAQSDFEHLTVHSEVLQNSMFDLIDAGKVDFAPGMSPTISADRATASSVILKNTATPRQDNPAPAGDKQSSGDHPPSRYYCSKYGHRSRSLR